MSGDDGRRPADDSTPDDSSERAPEDAPTDGSSENADGDADPHADSTAGDFDSSPEESTRGPESNGGATSSGRAADDEGSGGADAPPTHAVPNARSDESVLHRFRHAEEGPFLFLREVLSSVGVVVAVGLLLFAISGVWPPMVAVESGSMEPNMYRGDLVFITEPGRMMPAEATYGDTGVVTAVNGEQIGYRSFGGYGSVVVYDSPNKFGPPIIHRARFWVEDGENWYDRANPDYVNAPSCEQLANCPAPHAGFITKGDANSGYDQAMRIAEPVKPGWITGTARVRVPYLGWIRLFFSEGFAAIAESTGPVGSTLVGPTPTHSLGAQPAVERPAAA